MPEKEDVAASAEPACSRIVSLEELQAADFEAPLREYDGCDTLQMALRYDAAVPSDEANRHVYRLLWDVCTIRMRSTENSPAFGPRSAGVLKRTAVPRDFSPDQSAVFAQLAPLTQNPLLRARFADFAWTNNRKDGASAAVAISAYCDVVDGLLAGHIKPSYSYSPAGTAFEFAHRAAQIEHLTKKRTKRSPRVIAAFLAVYQALADSTTETGLFRRAAEVVLTFQFVERDKVAADLERVATAASAAVPPFAVASLLELAADLHQKSGDLDARRRCLIQEAEFKLAMRDRVGSPGAKASWTKDVLLLLQHVPGMEEREHQLEAELRDLQKAAVRQMGSIPIEISDPATQEAVSDGFWQMSLSDALREFVLLASSRDPKKLREEALEAAKQAPLVTALSAEHVDDQGRTAARSAGAPHEGEPTESWFRRTIEQSEGLHRLTVVANFIEPARVAIHAKYGIEEYHFSAIVGLSILVPNDQKPLLALGFARFFQGDMMSATHLLLPLMEAAMRNLLNMNGQDTGKIRDDSTEEDYSLSGLFSRFRSQLDSILTPALAAEIDALFNSRPGPALRHELAHGQISAGMCFHPTVYYANWLMFRLCCIPVLSDWQMVEEHLSSFQ